MCFHNSMNKNAQQLADRYGRKTDIAEIYRDIIDERYHVNAFSNPLCYAVTDSDELQAYYWGLIPFWERSQEGADHIRRMTYNAKSETVFEKPSFREPIRTKRCLIPSTGYFEYHHNEDKTTTPYFIFLRNQQVFSMAGIHDSWTNPATGQIINTFSIITTQANLLTSEIHNGGKSPHRMPVILSSEDEKTWLDNSLNKNGIIELMKPFRFDKMDAYPITNDFIKMQPNDPKIIDQIY